MRSNSPVGAYVLIALGLYFLIEKMGWLPDLGPFLRDWWPLILIIVGVAMLVRRRPRS